jgi:hypothetical protein
LRCHAPRRDVAVDVFPAHRQRQHRRQQAENTIGAGHRPGARNLAVQRLDIAGPHCLYLLIAERRQYPCPQHRLIVTCRARTLLRQVFGDIAVGQLLDGRRRLFGDAIGERIAAILDPTPQRARLLARLADRPCRPAADRVATLLASGAVIQDE